MSSVRNVVNHVWPKLVLFFKTVAIYFVMFMPTEKPSILAMILKCLPVLSLMLFVLLRGMSFEDKYKYSRRILIGLFFGCIGDACLIWPNYFEIGMLSFAVGHIFYISAFGFKPLNSVVGIVISIGCALGVYKMFSGLHGVLTYGVPIYTALIGIMIWRSIARIRSLEDLRSLNRLSGCMGGILFGISDFIIGIDKFQHPVIYSQVFVMSTYYAAQLGIALSVVDSKSSIQME